MNKEIERKFLLKELPPSGKIIGSVLIEQHYLAVSETSEIRIRREITLGSKPTLTIKSLGSTVRTEVTKEINVDEYKELSELAISTIKKERITGVIRVNGVVHTIEIDKYKDSDLILCEIEFDSIEECNQFEAPEWLGEDVTELDEYKNRNIARNRLTLIK